VRSVWGWNQWQKWVTPRLVAHSRIVWATDSAISMSSRVPFLIVSNIFLNTLSGRHLRIAARLNVFEP
jgi:hypothetical protein